jgi:ribose transport system substrate-binding protein
MKKLVVVAMCLVALLGIFCCEVLAADKPLVGIAVPEAPTGWVAAVQWTAKNKADELGLNYRLVASASTNDQANQLEELVAMGCKIIVLFPHNDELAVAAKRVMDAGVTLINFDRTLGSTKPDYYVAGNNYNMGVAGGEYIIEKLGGKGKVVIVYTPNLGNIFEERKQGFMDSIQNQPGIEVIGTYTPENASAEAGLAIMSDVLTQNPQIDAIYSSDDESSIGMLQAIKEAGRKDIKAITGGGGAQNYFKLFAQYPDIWASSQTYAPYMMNTCVEMAAGLLEGKTYPKETIVPTSCVDRETYQAYLDANGITPSAPY